MASLQAQGTLAPVVANGFNRCIMSGRVLVTSGAVNAASDLPPGVSCAKAATGKYTFTLPQCNKVHFSGVAYTASAAKDAKVHRVGAIATSAGQTTFSVFHIAGDADAAPDATAPDAAADPADNEGFEFIIVADMLGVV